MFPSSTWVPFMTYILDPIERLEAMEDCQIGKMNEDDQYPCIECGRFFDPESMIAISINPSSPLVCCREDCKSYNFISSDKDKKDE